MENPAYVYMLASAPYGALYGGDFQIHTCEPASEYYS
jgi:hypothetical protein